MCNCTFEVWSFGPSGMTRSRSVETALNLPGPGCDQQQAPSYGGKSPRGTNLHEKHSAQQYRPDSVAEFAARDGHHHDPVCWAAVRGCGGSGTGLEPLIFSQMSLAIQLL